MQSWTSVQGTIDYPAGRDVRIEFFSSPTCDDSGHGQGQTPVGALTLTGSGGPAAFSALVAAGFPAGHVITATVTDLNLPGTSEFSRCRLQATAPPPPAEPPDDPPPPPEPGDPPGPGTPPDVPDVVLPPILDDPPPQPPWPPRRVESTPARPSGASRTRGARWARSQSRAGPAEGASGWWSSARAGRPAPPTRPAREFGSR